MSHTAYADLEIDVRRASDGYSVDMRFRQPGSDADVRLISGDAPIIRFDLDRLREALYDAEEYSVRLSASLFGNVAFREAFVQARDVAQALNVPLRLRLFIAPNAAELHSLRWEMLRDPQHDTLLLTSEQICFSRYLSSADWRPVRTRPLADLRALVVIANPSNLENYRLSPVDVEGELARARASFGDIPITELAAPGQATVNNLAKQLRDGYDILYLVCHGALIKGEPRLWLENDDGSVVVTAGSELVTRLRELRQPPRLIVLASCQSAGDGNTAAIADATGALVALGPVLAEAGIPSVLAMQGAITMRTVAAFMPVFFGELRRDGQIDRAVAVARGAVRDQPDWWMPVLFMRLADGRLWAAEPASLPLTRRTWRRWLAQRATPRRILAGAASLITLSSALVVLYLSATGWLRPPQAVPAPRPMTGQLNIAVAPFSYRDVDGRVKQLPEGQDSLANQVYQQLVADITPVNQQLNEQFGGGERAIIQVRPPTETRWLSGTSSLERSAQAAALADEIAADIVVYGMQVYDEARGTSSFTPTFYLSPRKLIGDGLELEGAYPFGRSLVSFGTAQNAFTIGEISAQLRQRTAALAQFLIGLDAYFRLDYSTAERYFAIADRPEVLGDADGKDMFFYFRATNAGRRSDLDPVQAQTLAGQYYQSMLEISSATGNSANQTRARLGLAAVKFAQSRFDCGNNPQVDRAGLWQAVDAYREAIEAAVPAESRDLPIWARFGQGRAYFCLANAGEARTPDGSATLDRAKDELQRVIQYYEDASPREQRSARDLTAESHNLLSLIFTQDTSDQAIRSANLATAVEHSQAAVDLAPDPHRKAIFALQLARPLFELKQCDRAEQALRDAADFSQSMTDDVEKQRYTAFRTSIERERANTGCAAPTPAP